MSPLLPQMHVSHKSFIRLWWGQQLVGTRLDARARQTPAAVSSPLHVAGADTSWPTQGPAGQREHHSPPGRAESCFWSIVKGLDWGRLSKGGKAIRSPPAREEDRPVSGVGREQGPGVTLSPPHACARGASVVTEGFPGRARQASREQERPRARSRRGRSPELAPAAHSRHHSRRQKLRGVQAGIGIPPG